jgi:hypothetical protein
MILDSRGLIMNLYITRTSSMDCVYNSQYHHHMPTSLVTLYRRKEVLTQKQACGPADYLLPSLR